MFPWSESHMYLCGIPVEDKKDMLLKQKPCKQIRGHITQLFYNLVLAVSSKIKILISKGIIESAEYCQLI